MHFKQAPRSTAKRALAPSFAFQSAHTHKHTSRLQLRFIWIGGWGGLSLSLEDSGMGVFGIRAIACSCRAAHASATTFAYFMIVLACCWLLLCICEIHTPSAKRAPESHAILLKILRAHRTNVASHGQHANAKRLKEPTERERERLVKRQYCCRFGDIGVFGNQCNARSRECEPHLRGSHLLDFIDRHLNLNLEH